MKDFLCILVCFFIILCLFMVVVYYTGAFWVKVFKFVYRFSEKYWREILALHKDCYLLCRYNNRNTYVLSLVNRALKVKQGETTR